MPSPRRLRAGCATSSSAARAGEGRRRVPRCSRPARCGRSAQALGRNDILISDVGLHKLWIGAHVPGPRAQHRADRQRPGRHGLRAAVRDRGEARPPRSPRRDRQRRRRVPHERAGARDGGPAADADRERHLGEQPVRLDRLEAGQEVRRATSGPTSPIPTSSSSPRPSGSPAWRCECGRGLRAAPVARDVRSTCRRSSCCRSTTRSTWPSLRNSARRQWFGHEHATVNAQEQSILDRVPTQLYIGGEWRDATGGGTLPVEDPATGETIAEVADATVEDAVSALDAAVAAQAEFAATPPRERSEILRRAYEALIAQADDLALLMTLEMGKSVAESKAEILYAADFFHWFAERGAAHRRVASRSTKRAPAASSSCASRSAPACSSRPGTSRMAMGTRKIGPAIAAGCTSVIKPAKQTPLSMLMLAKILEEAGLPGGVAERGDGEVQRQDDGAAHQGPAAAQAVLHRVDRGRPRAHESRRRAGPEDLDGARRQRPVHRLRGRRPRRCRRRRDAREDAQRRRGLHVGQPLPRRRVGRRRVRRASSPTAWAR